MLHYLNEQLARAPMAVGERVLIENVSRRAFLKGTASGHRRVVVAMQLLPFRTRRRVRAVPHRRPRHAERHRHQSARVRLDRSGRHGDHRRPSLGDGHGRPDQPADGDRRRDGGRLGAGEDRPGAGRRAEVRQPGHRRLAQHAPPHPADAADGCGGALDAGAGGGQEVGRRSWSFAEAKNHEVVLLEKAGEGMAETDQRLGYGELAPAAMALPGAAVRAAAPSRTRADFRYIGKGEVQIYDLHDITTGKAIYGADVQPARAEVRGDRAAAGGRRQGQVGRQLGGAGGSRGRAR